LLAEDGVTSHSLLAFAQELMQQDAPLSLLFKPYALRLLTEIQYLPLHPVVQLLLTACQVSKPASFEHAVQAMLLNGALAMSQNTSTPNLRLAMLSGLLHDVGEMYIAPQHGEADANQTLSTESYRHLVAHPHVGQLLITQMTNYPPAIARAIAEHHERLDGSGYPHCLHDQDLSPLGRLTAVTEAALNALRTPHHNLAHASATLRVIPGEFDLTWMGLISNCVRQQTPLQAQMDEAEIAYRLQGLDNAMQAAERGAQELLQDSQFPNLRPALELAVYLLSRLRVGWNTSGLWSQQTMAEQDVAEVEAVENELLFRLQGIERAAFLQAGELPAAHAKRLEKWCEMLQVAH
jgi:HD domain